MSELRLITQRSADLRREEWQYLLKTLKPASGPEGFTSALEDGILTLWVPGYDELLPPDRVALVADVLGLFEQSLVPDHDGWEE